MNETVRGMVEQLFENTVMNDETNALKDEVMNNCQERYADLTEKGLPEEEILEAVSESLKGMEDIVASYPRKETALSEQEEKTVRPADGTGTFDPSAVQRLVVRLTDGSIDVVPGEEELITVELTSDPETSLTAELSDGALNIIQRKIPGGGAENTSRPAGSRAPRDIAGGINDAIRQLTQIVQRFGVGASVNNQVRVHLPANCRLAADIQSLSGDIRWNGAAAEHMLLDTTSGDLEAFVPTGDPVCVAQIKSASGDIRSDLDAEDLTLQSMSGDIQWSGTAQRLTATSISGDLNMSGSFRESRLKSVSGDVTVSADEKAAEMRAISTSGDVTIHLSAGVTAAKTDLWTISGDTHVNNLLISDTAPLFVQADSVSGDITLTRYKFSV